MEPLLVKLEREIESLNLLLSLGICRRAKFMARGGELKGSIDNKGKRKVFCFHHQKEATDFRCKAKKGHTKQESRAGGFYCVLLLPFLCDENIHGLHEE